MASMPLCGSDHSGAVHAWKSRGDSIQAAVHMTWRLRRMGRSGVGNAAEEQYPELWYLHTLN